tara:strand:+ start:370 stop:570 length:201 start_codon:yes stop_codon:yes gene_type:complete
MSLIKKFETEGTLLDGELNGSRPKAPMNNTGKAFINGTFDKGEYLNNLPNDIDTDVERSRAADATA